MTAGFDWTAEAKDHLRALWMEGKSASAIVTAFGKRFACAPPTRNAVLGTAHRMELPPRKSPIVRKDPSECGDRYQRKLRAAAAPKPTPGRIGLADLTPRMCRWPHGHPHQPETFYFCGATTDRPGAPYCAEHADRAYTKAGRAALDGRTESGRAIVDELVGGIVAGARKKGTHAKQLIFGGAP